MDWFAALLTLFTPGRGESGARNLERIFGETPRAREWARPVLDSAGIDPAKYPVRAIRELRVQERRLSLAGAKTLVDQLR